MSEKNTFETILKWIVVVILAFAALKVLLGVLGIAFAFAASVTPPYDSPTVRGSWPQEAASRSATRSSASSAQVRA